MKPEKQFLLNDLIEGGGRHETTLLAAGKILRRRRQWRAAWRMFAVPLVCAASALLLEHNRTQPGLARVSPPKSNPPAPPQLQSLTDDQLLSMFTNVPVALATLPNGRKLLVFPRPEDEARLVRRI